MKNVERIELGRYEMETWYMSPLPPQFKDCKVSTWRFERQLSPGVSLSRHAAQQCHFVSSTLRVRLTGAVRLSNHTQLWHMHNCS